MTRKRISILTFLVVIILAGISLFWMQNRSKREDKNYIEFVFVVDDEAKIYTEEFAYFIFLINDKGETEFGKTLGDMPRFNMFGGVSLEERSMPPMGTCGRYHSDLLTHDKTDYNKPENRRFSKFLIDDSIDQFFIAHMLLDDNSTNEQIRELGNWRLSEIKKSIDRKHVFKASELEKSQTMLIDSPHKGVLEKLILEYQVKKFDLPRTYPMGKKK